MKGCVIKRAEITEQERRKIRTETGHTIPRIIAKNMIIGWKHSKWACAAFCADQSGRAV